MTMSKWRATLLCAVIGFGISPIFWTAYLLLLAYRALAFVMALPKYSPVLGTANIMGQEPDTPNVFMGTAIFFEGPADFTTFRRRFWDNIVMATDGRGGRLFPKFGYCLSFRYGFLCWSETPDAMDIDRHLYVLPDGSVDSEEELQAVTDRLFNRVLPAGQPPWEGVAVHLKEGWRSPRHSADVVPTSVLLMRFHHSIMDGMTFNRIMLKLADNGDRAMEALREMLGFERLQAARKGFIAKKVAALVVYCLSGLFLAPFLLATEALNNVIRINGVLNQQKLTGRKVFCASSPVCLSRIKAIKNVLTGSSINDVIMAAVTGAVEAFIRKRFSGCHTKLGDNGVYAGIPVSTQDLMSPPSIKNNMMMLVTKLPTGFDDPCQRVRQVKKIMDQGKKSVYLLLAKFTKDLLVLVLPRPLLLHVLRKKAPSLGVSNIPGSPIQLTVEGFKISSISPFAPNFHATGLTVMCMSYCDALTVNVVMDTGIGESVTVAKEFIKLVEDQFDQLEVNLRIDSGSVPSGSLPQLCNVIVDKFIQKAHYNS